MRLDNFIRQKADIRTYAAGQMFTADTLVGIEVELEKYVPGEPKDWKYWRAEADGSLREGGIEFVLRQPLTGLDLEQAVRELDADILNTKYEINRRCSTHVHIDARDMSVNHMKAMVFVYTMVERLIYDMVSPERGDSFYCMPLYDSVSHRKIISNAIDKLDFSACPKYSGLNLQTLITYGSLEFRMKEGLEKDHNLVKWVQALMLLKSGTKQYEDVPLRDILRMYSDNQAESIIRAVFGDMAEELIGDKPYNESLKPCMRAAQDLLLFTKGDTLNSIEKKWVSSTRRRATGSVDEELLERAIQFRELLMGE